MQSTQGCDAAPYSLGAFVRDLLVFHETTRGPFSRQFLALMGDGHRDMSLALAPDVQTPSNIIQLHQLFCQVLFHGGFMRVNKNSLWSRIAAQTHSGTASSGTVGPSGPSGPGGGAGPSSPRSGIALSGVEVKKLYTAYCLAYERTGMNPELRAALVHPRILQKERASRFQAALWMQKVKDESATLATPQTRFQVADILELTTSASDQMSDELLKPTSPSQDQVCEVKKYTVTPRWVTGYQVD